MKTCSICLEEIKSDKHRTSCNHYFHFKCIKRWNIKHRTCPECRHPMRRIIKCRIENHRGSFRCKKCRKKSCFSCFMASGKCPLC